MKNKFLLLILIVISSCSNQPDYDLIIKNGSIIDGSGQPRFSANIGIKDDTIDVLDALDSKPAKKYIDATNLIVAPGFIDVHTHAVRCLLYTSPSPRDVEESRMPSSA